MAVKILFLFYLSTDQVPPQFLQFTFGAIVEFATMIFCNCAASSLYFAAALAASGVSTFCIVVGDQVEVGRNNIVFNAARYPK